MPIPVIIPKATITMEDGAIGRWYKAEGERVAKGDPLFELETDKALAEVDSPGDGIVLRIMVTEGPVKVEQVVAWIGQPGEHLVESVAPVTLPAAPVQAPSPGISSIQPQEKGRIVATPAARRRSRELGFDLAAIPGTGPGGRITEEDVIRASEVLRRSAVTEKGPRDAGRKTLMQQLAATWQNVPHIHIAKQLSVAGLVAAKRVAEQRIGSRVTYTDLLLYVLSRLLLEFPRLTMTWSGNDLQPAAQLNLSFTVDTQYGVVAPVIFNAGPLSLAELGAERRRLTQLAVAHRLKPEQLQGGVFTLTNLGMDGVDYFAPIMNFPQTAILATGRLAQQPVVASGELTVGWQMWTNLALDHRVTDGRLAGRFLSRLEGSLDRLPKELEIIPQS